MSAPTEDRIRETWDRLVLLLISRPRAGWEAEFEDKTRREIQRLALPAVKTERDE
jgi:NADPH-dependent 2,4-dienoyl-CoA reductase/sulfur reductase-like enzyme